MMTNVSLGEAGAGALLGYSVVFLGLVMLMIVVTVMGKIMTARKAPAKEAQTAVPVAAGVPAPGSAGPLKLYDTPPRDAAMCMAIVADQLGKPINELRFISIKEVK